MGIDVWKGESGGKKIKRNGIQYFLVVLFCVAIITGCGKEEEDNAYYIIETESEQIFSRVKNDANTFLLGNRFYLGEIVQLAGYRAEDGTTMDIYLCKASGEEVLLWEGIPKAYGYGSWYLDSDGNGYCLYTNEVIRYDKGGGECYRREREEIKIFMGACESGEGTMLLAGQTTDGVLKLIGLSAGNGEMSDTGIILDMDSRGTEAGAYISGSGQEFLLLDKDGIWEADVREGRKECIMAFTGGSYTPEAVSDFRMLEDGTAQILRGSDIDILHSVNISETRTVLVLRVQNIKRLAGSWLAECIVRFNMENSEYYVVMEDAGEGNLGDFREKTDMELVLGKGPDMVRSMVSNPLALMEKGALEDLAPYMEASGICEEDYFPAAFDCWRDGDKIYGINVAVQLMPGLWVDEGLFPEGVGHDLPGLVQALAEYQGEAILSKGIQGKTGVLNKLLEGSDSLGGMVDWEEGTCDFKGQFFRNLLEVNKKYAYRNGEDITVLGGAVYYSLYNYGNIYGNKEEMAKLGRECLYSMFDDANLPGAGYNLHFIMVGSGSVHKDGAWEFIRFLLSEEQQSRISWINSANVFPANRKAFDILAAKELAEGGVMSYEIRADGQIVGHLKMTGMDMKVSEIIERYQLTEEKVDSVREMLENARALPMRTKPIMDIIEEEAKAYIDGHRSLDDVCQNVQNRVQLYLNENK